MPDNKKRAAARAKRQAPQSINNSNLVPVSHSGKQPERLRLERPAYGGDSTHDPKGLQRFRMETTAAGRCITLFKDKAVSGTFAYGVAQTTRLPLEIWSGYSSLNDAYHAAREHRRKLARQRKRGG